MIVKSQSGTGKTGCFALGILNVIDPQLQQTQAICLCPTLELGIQIAGVIRELNKYTNFTIGEALRGSDGRKPMSEQIIVGSPGKVAQMIDAGRINTKNVKVCVLDEADYLLDENAINVRNDVQKLRKYVCVNNVFKNVSCTEQSQAMHDFGSSLQPSKKMIRMQRVFKRMSSC